MEKTQETQETQKTQNTNLTTVDIDKLKHQSFIYPLSIPEIHIGKSNNNNNSTTTTHNRTEKNNNYNNNNHIFIITLTFYILCILIETFMVFSQPNQPLNPILQIWNHEQVLKLQNKTIYGTESIYKQAIYECRDNGRAEARITISLAYKYIQDTTSPVIVKLKTKFISEKTTKIMTDQVTPTQVLKLERLWREFKPSGTPQNVRRLKLTLNPQKYKKEDDDINMDEDQNGSNNVLDLNNWQHRYDGIYGITNTFSGSKNSEIFPSTWNVIGQLIPNKQDQQKLPASSDPMGSDQH